MMADFNCVWSVNDRFPVDSDRSARLLYELIEDSDLIDIGRLLLSAGQLKFTHFPVSSYDRLDRTYVPISLLKGEKEYSVTPLLFRSVSRECRNRERGEKNATIEV